MPARKRASGRTGERTTRKKQTGAIPAAEVERRIRAAVNAERARLGVPVDEPTGRPRHRIDWPKVDAMLGISATVEEVASCLDVSEDTIERACVAERGMTFRELSLRKRGKKLVSLRRTQFRVALGSRHAKQPPNVTMLIWLGKQLLNQTDKLQHVDPQRAKAELSRLLGVSPDDIEDDGIPDAPDDPPAPEPA